MAERYLYIGTAGGMLFVAALAMKLSGQRIWVKWALPVTLIVAAGTASHHRVGVWEGSETLWRDAIHQSPNATLPRLQLGHALEERALNEHPEIAAKTLDEVVALYEQGGRLSDNTNERIQSNIKLATVLIRTSRLSSGLNCLDAIDRDVKVSGAPLPRVDRDSLIITRASALIALQRSDEARLTLNRIGPLSPSRIDARNMLATLSILEATASLHQAKTPRAQQSALTQFEKGLKVYDSILGEFPNHTKTRFDRARALHVATWRPDALINVTNEVVALTKEFPNDARSWSLRARVIAEVDQLRAISHLGRAIEIDPYQEGYYLRLSLLLKELGKNKMAAQTLLGALQVLPQNDALSRQLSEFYLSFAHHYRNTKEPALALEAVERSISLSGESLDALVLRGELEENFAVDDTRKTSERTRFWERARRSFEAALLLDTTDARAAGGLGRYHKYRGYAALWEATKQVDKETVTERARREKRLRTQAMSDFARAIELGGRGEEFVAIQKQLQRYVEQLLVDGRRDLAALDFAAARARVTEAAELQPSAVNVWILTARIEEDDGFPIKARVAWRRALTVAPHSLQSLYELGKSEYTASEYKEAKAHLQKFVDLASADDGKAAALAAELNVARRIIARCVEALR